MDTVGFTWTGFFYLLLLLMGRDDILVLVGFGGIVRGLVLIRCGGCQ